MDSSWYQMQITRSCDSLALAISDFVRLPTISESWIVTHVNFPFFERYKELKKTELKKGIIVATGHLGSFELQAYLASVLGYPISFVVRNFKAERLDAWWNLRREKFGNKVIPRKGAYKKIISEIKSGRDVGILFDQNVKRSHAVFVDWFGKKAATTKSLALAALDTESRVLVASLKTLEFDRYSMQVVECDFTSLYENKNMTRKEKIFEITQTVSKHYEDMIRDFPEGWFWMHRRWKTTETEDQPEDFY